jgi:cadmium resistance protein CadD (predicted permease)
MPLIAPVPALLFPIVLIGLGIVILVEGGAFGL